MYSIAQTNMPQENERMFTDYQSQDALELKMESYRLFSDVKWEDTDVEIASSLDICNSVNKFVEVCAQDKNNKNLE